MTEVENDDDESPRRQKRTYIRTRRRPSELARIQRRRESVQKSIVNFIDNNTSIDDFKDDLVRTARRHLGENTVSNPVMIAKKEVPVEPDQHIVGDDEVEFVNLNDESSAIVEGHENSFSNKCYLKKRQKAKKTKEYKPKKDRNNRARAVREKLDRSLHGSSDDEFELDDDDVISNGVTHATSNDCNVCTPLTEKILDQPLSMGRHHSDNELLRDDADDEAKQVTGTSKSDYPIDPPVRQENADKSLYRDAGSLDDEDELLLDDDADQILKTDSEENEVTASTTDLYEKPLTFPHDVDNKNESHCQNGHDAFQQDTDEKIATDVDTSAEGHNVGVVEDGQNVFSRLFDEQNNSEPTIQYQLQEEELQEEVETTPPLIDDDVLSQNDERSATRNSLKGTLFHRDDNESGEVPTMPFLLSNSEVHYGVGPPSNLDESEQEMASIYEEPSKSQSLTTDARSLVEETNDADIDDSVNVTVSMDALLHTATDVNLDQHSSYVGDDNSSQNHEESESQLIDHEKAISCIVEQSELRIDEPTQNDLAQSPFGDTTPTDLNQILSHLAVLNDFKDLVGSLRKGPELISTAEKASAQNRSRFHRMFQIKCGLMNSLDESHEDGMVQLKTLKAQYDLEDQDLNFILNHVRTAQKHYKEIRWDLIESLIFPDTTTRMSDSRYGMATGSSLGEDAASEIFSIAEVASRSWGSHKAGEAESCILTVADSSPAEGETPLSRRELFQEAILDLYEMEEDCLEELAGQGSFERQQMLIELLRATSEEEAHLSSLTLEDVTEIVNHIQICQEFGTPVEWPLIQQIVFPMGLAKQVHEADRQIQNDDIRSASTDGFDDDDQGHESDTSDNDSHDAHFRDYVELSAKELDIVLRHINLCNETGEAIRWDLVGEILFPCDIARQEMLSSTGSTSVRPLDPPVVDGVVSEMSGVIPKSSARAAGQLEEITNHILKASTRAARARAALSLSNHDWEVTDLLDISENGYNSFGEDSHSTFATTEFQSTEVSRT